MKIKNLICLLLAIVLSVACASCTVYIEPNVDSSEPDASSKTLAAPQGISVSESGVVSWNHVENAEGYYVYVNEIENRTTVNSYTLDDVYTNSVIYVVAWADGCENSPASQKVNFTAQSRPAKKLEISLECTVDGKQSSTLKSGQVAKFAAKVSGGTESGDEKVIFEVVNDGAATEQSRTSNSIEFKGNDVSGDKVLTVTAVCEADSSVKASKAIIVVAKTELTDAMIKALCGEDEVISFDGFVMIDVYSETDLGDEVRETLVQSNSVTMRTAMKTGKWYAEYENANVGVSQQIFFERDDDGYACESAIDFNNRISRYPLKTADGGKVLWSDAGYFNCFKGLTVADFEFNEQTWRWQYKDKGSELVKNMVASCNPYDFYVDKSGTFELIIDDGEIIGICASSGKDYSIVAGYMTKQRLYVALDSSKNVEVPEMRGYTSIDDYTDAPTKAEYKKLQTAIANMQNLKSYKTELINISAMQGLSSTTVSGYQEIVTDDVCFFRPYNSYATDESDIFTDENSYGYRVAPEYENVYNTFYYTEGEEGAYSYQPTRSYAGKVKNSTPSFDFCAEIFNRGCYYDEENDLTRFIADDAMSNVATLLYSGVGSDINLYGIFATVAESSTTEFATYVDVQKVNGEYYITASGFYYSIDSQGFYGVIDITYSDFNVASISENDLDRINAFKSKPLPSSWADVNIIANYYSEEETLVPADEYFKDYFFGKGSVPALQGITVEEIPFFSSVDALGDAFGLGMSQKYIKSTASGNVTIDTIKLYYDVPLDIDYTISSSLDTLDVYLKSQGFTKASDGSGEYRKEGCNLVIMPADESLDLFIYIWAEKV